MASPNPDLTAVWKFPSPTPSDPPDVPGDIKALADRLETVLPRIVVGTITGNVVASGTELTGTFPAGHFVAGNPIYVVTGWYEGQKGFVSVMSVDHQTLRLRVYTADGQGNIIPRVSFIAIQYVPGIVLTS